MNNDINKSKEQLIAELDELRKKNKAKEDKLKAANQQLDASHVKLKKSLIETLENMSDGFVSLDENWHYTYVNKKAGEILGRKPEDLVGKHIWTEFPEGIGQPVYKKYYKGVETQKAIYFEDYYQPWDRWLENRVFPSKKGLSIFFHDITERKQAQEELQRSETLFRAITEQSGEGIALADNSGNYVKVNPALCKITGYSEEELLTMNVRDLVPSETKIKLFPQVRNGKSGKREAELLRKDGSRFMAEINGYPIQLAGQNLVLGITRDITERVQAEKELQKRFKELSAVYAASQRLQKLLFPDQLAQEIIEILERTLNYTYGAVLLVADDGEMLVPFALSTQNQGEEFLAKDKEYIRSKNVRVGRGITGWVAKHGQSVRVDDVLADPRYLSMREDVRSELCVPLLVGEQVIGVVNIESPEVGAYSEDDQRLLETIAAQISAALQNAHLLEDIRLHRDRLVKLSRRLAEARETEQRALGRELHDQFGQMLTALKLTLEIATQLPPEETNPKIEQARQIADELLSRVRTLSLELRPPMLDDLGLHSALLWLVNHYEQTSRIKAEFKQRGLEGARFDMQIETAAYRIAQEGFTNAARHAQATRVRLEVRVEAGRMHIEIEDDGVGFDPQTAPTYSRGLVGMRERAELLGGTFRIESHIGRGTRILVSLPVENGS